MKLQILFEDKKLIVTIMSELKIGKGTSPLSLHKQDVNMSKTRFKNTSFSA